MLIPFLWVLLVPQQPASAPQAPQDQPTAQAAANPDAKASGTSKDRLFFTLPNFFTLENAADAPPLTAGQKFKTTARSSFDPVEFAWYGLQAGISQAQNSDAEYGQGAEGYAKRFGVVFADGTVENLFTKAIFPSLLHQDPRYFQMGEGRFFHRAFYAVSSIFVTRSDSGVTQFNFSEIVGSATAAGISSFTYHPKDERNVTNALDIWGTQVAFDTLSELIKEFWPDMRRKLERSKSASAAPGH
jgi:hypothetical protein